MRPNEETVWQEVEKVVNQRVTYVERIMYTIQGTIPNPDDGGMMLAFANGEVLFLESGTNGALFATSVPWEDPFSGELDQETIEWISEFGQEIAIDVSCCSQYNQLIDNAINGVFPIFDDIHVLMGVQFVIGSKFLNFVIRGIEKSVLWGKDSEILSDEKFTIENPLQK